MKKVFTVFTIMFLTVIVNAQVYKGPAQGNVLSGAIVTTDTFNVSAPVREPKARSIKNVLKTNEGYQAIDFGDKVSKTILRYFDDPALVSPGADTAKSILINSWRGIAETNSIPPDPYIAAGPQHVMATVNSRFSIWDKQGNQLANIDADLWFRNLVPGVSTFDPKIIYDHFDKRWVMVWLEQNTSTKKSYYLISVSDDSIPTGRWFNWAIPAYKNGNDSIDSWSDYEGVGFDDDAVYFTSNQIQFSGAGQYARIKIIPKNKLYANTAGEITWTDLWDIRLADGTQPLWTLRPSQAYSKSSDYYLIYAPNEGGNFFTLFKISNPVTNPVLTKTSFSVTPYKVAPDAQQLGGGTMRLETSGTKFWQEPVYRDGYIWCVHSVMNPKSVNYSALHYVKYNIAENTVEEDYVFGAPGYWHYYPAIAVDKDHNVVITYSRSGESEYPGAYYTSRFKNAPAGFEASKVLKAGRANYVKDYASSRNRWGDYNGIWLDPADQNNIWMFSEYSEGLNTWGTWVGCVRLVPYNGVHLSPGSGNLSFNKTEVKKGVDTIVTTLSNVGKEDLIINSIEKTNGPFSLVSDFSFPVTLKTYESINLTFVFSPVTEGKFSGHINVSSNDNEFSGFELTGTTYKIHPAAKGIFYASAGEYLIQVNPGSAHTTQVGYSLFTGVNTLAVQPKTNIIYGTVTAGNSTAVIRMNAEAGDSYILSNVSTPGISSVGFDTSGNFYGVLSSGELYKIDVNSGNSILQCSIAMPVASIAFDPVTNDLYASPLGGVGFKRDRLYRVNINTGDTTAVGNTGKSSVKVLGFDDAGTLYAITLGQAKRSDSLIVINKSTGSGQTIGQTGNKTITAIAMGGEIITSVPEVKNVPLPDKFNLAQNYPNPFNPSTTIEYGLPVTSRVKIVIYNLLGQAVQELVNSEQPAGTYSFKWNASGMSSGIYFYEVQAAGINGKMYNDMKKMILMK